LFYLQILEEVGFYIALELESDLRELIIKILGLCIFYLGFGLV
jgi:hypothetical protein